LSLQNWRTGKKTQQTEPKSFAEAKTNYACKLFLPLSSVVSLSFSHDTAMAPSPHHNSTCFPRPTTLKIEHSKIIKKMERTKPRERERESSSLLSHLTENSRTVSNGVHCCRRRRTEANCFGFGGALLDSLYSLAFIRRICLFVAQILNVDGWLVTA
jgi:hypothetical protein